jgi:arylformamidase
VNPNLIPLAVLNMKCSLLSFALCALGLLVSPALADDKVPAAKAGYAVEVVKDQAYRTDKEADPEKHKLDLYLPKGQKDYPVLLFVHGGAWKTGDRKIYGRLGQTFARQGIGTVIISYRLSPKVQHPAHVQDVAKAFAWTHQNIARYGGSADQIFVCGHSAGGHLVALLATDETYLKAEKLSRADIKGVIPLSGVYTIVPSKRFDDIFGADREVCRQASPLTHVSGKEPPFLILYADKDIRMLDKSAERMHAALLKAKDEAAILEIKDRTHLTIITSLPNDGDPATKAILDFIDKHARRKPLGAGTK